MTLLTVLSTGAPAAFGSHFGKRLPGGRHLVLGPSRSRSATFSTRTCKASLTAGAAQAVQHERRPQIIRDGDEDNIPAISSETAVSSLTGISSETAVPAIVSVATIPSGASIASIPTSAASPSTGFDRDWGTVQRTDVVLRLSSGFPDLEQYQSGRRVPRVDLLRDDRDVGSVVTP